MASLVACVVAIYLASVDDSATVGWCFDCQLTGALLMRVIKPVVDFLSSPSPQSAFMKISNFKLDVIFFRNKIFKFCVFIK